MSEVQLDEVIGGKVVAAGDGARQGWGARVLIAALIGLVRLYQLVPRMGPARCRFHPSCSTYAIEAFDGHGAVRGMRLAVSRIARCQPFHPGGLDPVPPISARTRQA